MQSSQISVYLFPLLEYPGEKCIISQNLEFRFTVLKKVIIVYLYYELHQFRSYSEDSFGKNYCTYKMI